jgi:hypothetical protein
LYLPRIEKGFELAEAGFLYRLAEIGAAHLHLYTHFGETRTHALTNTVA